MNYVIPVVIEVDLTANLAILATCSGANAASESGYECGNVSCSTDRK